MPDTQKLERVAELKERIEGADALLLTEYRGLTVSEITQLRRSLHEAGASFAVVKNTLMQRAAAEAGIEALVGLLSGPSAVAFVSGDPVAAAKSIKAATKQYPTLVLKGGYLDGQVLDVVQAARLAELESREEMLSKIAGLMKSELSRAARAFVSAQSQFLSLLEAYADKVSEGESPAGAEQAPGENVASDETTEAAASDVGNEEG